MKVFYQVTGMSSTRLSEGTTSNTVLTLTRLSLGILRSIFVVDSEADGDRVLPSDHSNTAAIMIGYVFCEYRLYLHVLHCADIPQLSSVSTPQLHLNHGVMDTYTAWFLLLVTELVTPVSSDVAHYQYSKQTLNH